MNFKLVIYDVNTYDSSSLQNVLRGSNRLTLSLSYIITHVRIIVNPCSISKRSNKKPSQG
jgi:hypothetical protein